MKSLVTESLNSIHKSVNEGMGSLDKAAYELSSNVDTTPIIEELKKLGLTIEPFILKPQGLERQMTRLEKTDVTGQCNALMMAMFQRITIGGAWAVLTGNDLTEADDDDDSLLIYVRIDLTGEGNEDDDYDGYSNSIVHAYSADGQTWEFRE
jgi:hypothetical protein